MRVIIRATNVVRHQIGVRKRAFADAMECLLSAGRIQVETSGPPSEQRSGLIVAPAKERDL